MNSQIIIGGGSWGMGIAAALAAANQDVGLLVRNPQTVQLLPRVNATAARPARCCGTCRDHRSGLSADGRICCRASRCHT